jgi:hypothetical protein
MKFVYLAAVLTSLVLFSAGSVQADPVGGPKFDSDLLRPGQTVEYGMALRGEELTLFRVDGDGDGDIDCALFDEDGNAITNDVSGTDGCIMSVTPAWTGRFTVRLVNTGSEASKYTFRAL